MAKQGRGKMKFFMKHGCMVSKVVFGLLPLLLVGCSIGEKSNESLSPGKVRPIFYEVSKNGKKIGTLFGTIHLGVNADDLPSSFFATFDESDHFVAEIDPEKLKGDQKSSLFESFSKGKIRSGMSEISSDTQKSLRKYFQSFHAEYGSGQGAADLEFLEKLDLNGLVGYTNIIYQAKGQVEVVNRLQSSRHLKKFLDFDLVDRAKRLRMTTTYLDAPLMELLRQCASRETSVRFLSKVASAERPEVEYADIYIDLVSAYRRGEKDYSRYYDSTDQQLKCLIDKRNVLWKTSIVGAFRAYENTFVAVGRLHLDVGPESLVSLLQSDGYSVEVKQFE
jgi:uncharacterized protein YbaP (TraB family)